MGYGVAMLTRGYTHLSAEERETLSLGLAHGQSLRTMATVLGRAPSTLSREAARRTHLGQGCSPEQIAGRLQRAYPDDMGKQFWPRPSMWSCMCCRVESCAANCWPHCVRRARRVGLGRGGQIDGARSPI